MRARHSCKPWRRTIALTGAASRLMIVARVPAGA
jgi:hypothetical protein